MTNDHTFGIIHGRVLNLCIWEISPYEWASFQAVSMSTKNQEYFLRNKIKVKLVAIAKDEAPYLPHWIYHHFSIGIDFIEIHLNGITDNSLEICKKISRRDKRLIYLKGDERLQKCLERNQKYQISAYNKSINRSKNGKDSATHILFLDIDEYLINTKGRNCIKSLIRSCPDADAFSFLWYFEHWQGNKKAFANPLTGHRSAVKVCTLKTLIKVSSRIKSYNQHNAIYDENCQPKNLLAETGIHLIPKINACERRAMVTKQLLQMLGEDNVEEWIIYHSIFKSRTEYLSSLLRGNQQSLYSAPVKTNRWGLTNGDGDIVYIDLSRRQKRHKIGYALFLLKYNLYSELIDAKKYLFERRLQLHSLLRNEPWIREKWPHIFKGTMYSSESTHCHSIKRP